MSERHLDLMLTVDGGLELRTIEDEALVWSNDDDEDFLEWFAGQEVFDEDDLRDVAAWLCEAGIITSAEHDDLEFSQREEDDPPVNWDDDDAAHRHVELEEGE